MAVSVSPFLMFEGDAEEAVSLYVSVIPDSRIDAIEHFGEDGPGRDGTTRRMSFTLAGHPYMALDSPIEHKFSFTPSISLFVTVADEAQFDTIYKALSHLGQVMMPVAAYPFARKFSWFNDRFGVSWQLSFV
jgi:predicted 3-demethylubiquinone-9 3-methyltransferase (glyoxalase superfamily)